MWQDTFLDLLTSDKMQLIQASGNCEQAAL